MKESNPPQGDDDDDDDDFDDDDLGIQASVVDQFDQPKVFDVKKPTRLCNPVDKEGEGIKNPDNQLLCYQVKPARGEPRHRRIKNIFVHDQFGPKQVDTRKERELCVPVQGDLPTPTPVAGVVFVTSTTHKGDLRKELPSCDSGASDGLACADAICAARAASAGLIGTFAAWLSTSTVDAIDRIGSGTGGWHSTCGDVVATSKSDLSDGSIAHGISAPKPAD